MFLSLVVGSLIYGLFGWASSDEVPIWGLALLQVPLWAGYLGVTLWATSTKGDGVVSDLGVSSRWFDAPVGLLIGVLTQVVVLPLLYLPIFVLTGTDSDELSAPARELADRAGSLPSWLLFALLVGVGAPVVEELFYRGLFLRSLTKRGMHPAVGVLISSAVFAVIHFQVLQFAGLFAFGLIAGTLAARSGRLGPPIWAHIGFNMTTVVLLYSAS
jgi:membrane protease YdiL (CAAX protease family)